MLPCWCENNSEGENRGEKRPRKHTHTLPKQTDAYLRLRVRLLATVTVARRLSSSMAIGRPTSVDCPTTTQCLPAKYSALLGSIVSSNRITPAGVHGCSDGSDCRRQEKIWIRFYI
jgi:hypothetical protein